MRGGIKQIISERFATYGLMSVLSMVVVFHLLVLTGVIPFQIVWGGRLADSSRMIVFETVSIVVNVLMLLVVGAHTGVLRLKLNRKLTTAVLWGMVILFLLNTFGNLFSESQTEKLIFTPLTFILSVLSLRLAVSDKTTETSEEKRL